MLPNIFLNHWNKVLNFAVTNVAPAFSFSGGISTAVVSPFKDKLKGQKQKEDDERKCLDGYGIPLDLKEEVDDTFFKYAFEEDTAGMNDEARLCLKSMAGTTWGKCEDYEECVRSLAETWDKRVEEGEKALRVDIFLPEEDIMVGQKGMRYFEECWGKQRTGSGIKVECVRWKGTDHETTTSCTSGAIGRMFSIAKGLRTAG